MATSSKIDNIIYGAVHDGHDFRYIGFCKKVRSDDIQSVDVWIDDKQVETLQCDKRVDKISNIYDKAGFAFCYDLPDEYMGQKHLVSFTCNGIEIENSPLETITKDDDRFNEYKFMNSLSQPIDEEKIKDLYSKNAIGFLALEENLNDKEFIAYIKELMVRFPQVAFKAFYFTNEQKKVLQNIFSDNNRILGIELDNIYSIFCDIEIFIATHQNYATFGQLIYKIGCYNDLTHRIYFNKDLFQCEKRIKDFNPNQDSFYFNDDKYDYSQDEKQEMNENYAHLFCHKILQYAKASNTEFSEDDLIREWYYFIRIEYVLKYFAVKEFVNRIFK